MHNVFRTISNMGGFTPPLTAKGKRLATYGDAVLRAEVMRILITTDEGDLSVRANIVLSRSVQAELVRELGLIDFVSLPIGFYAGKDVLEEHAVATILESVVGECALCGNTKFATDVARMLISISYGKEPVAPELPYDGGGLPSGKETVDDVSEDNFNAAGGHDDNVSWLYQWAAHAKQSVTVNFGAANNGDHACNITVAGREVTGRHNSKRGAKRDACSQMRELLERPKGPFVINVVPEVPVDVRNGNATPSGDHVATASDHDREIEESALSPGCGELGAPFSELIVNQEEPPFDNSSLETENIEAQKPGVVDDFPEVEVAMLNALLI